MKKLALAALLVGTSLASGCIISSDDDDTAEGAFGFTWAIEAGVGNEITCTEAGAGGVQSIVTRAGTTQGVADIFDCDPGQATTPLFPFDDYVVVVNLIDQADPPGNLGSSLPRNETLDVDLLDLGNFIFDVGAATVNLSFSVDYGAAGGVNCLATGGGEDVEDQNTSLTLVGNGQCISVPLLLDGTQDLADICSELLVCVEPTVVQTLPDLDPGTYELTLEGLVDVGGTSTACYRSIDTNLALGDGDEDLGVLTVPFDGTACP
jgi:hypothetical protein